MRRYVLGIAVVAALALAAAGCGPAKSPAGDATTGKSAVPESTQATAGAAVPAAEQLITIADVEKVGGLKGVILVPYDAAKGAGGALNFAQADSALVLMFDVRDAAAYAQNKAVARFYNADVPGVGDEAFDGPKVAAPAVPYVLFVRKGGRMFSLSAYSVNGKWSFTQAQLKELALLVVARM
jgi:hypothetical protein